MILLIDNYDSFVFNLERYLRRLGQQTEVIRNDEVPLDRIASGEFSAVVISPGPKAPEHAGKTLEVIERFHRQIPMLGVCLGHQAICQALGARIVRAPQAVHGQSSPIEHQQSRLFAGLPSPFQAARYHSLIVDPSSLPESLKVTGWTASGKAGDARQSPPVIMAVEHVHLPLLGVQFHPESILSDVGYRILANFLQLAGLPVTSPLPMADFASPGVWENFQDVLRPTTGASQVDAKDEWPPAVLPQRSATGPEQGAP